MKEEDLLVPQRVFGTQALLARNQKPNKEKSKNKIEGVVAEVMAKGAQLHHEANDKPTEWFAPIEFN